MFLFLRNLCYFSSSAVALLVGISKFKHLYAAELQLSTRSPFHCQDRFIFSSKWWSENEVGKSVETVSPKDPQMEPKIDKSCSKARGAQQVTRPFQERFLIDFQTIFHRSWDHFWSQNGKNIITTN